MRNWAAAVRAYLPGRRTGDGVVEEVLSTVEQGSSGVRSRLMISVLSLLDARKVNALHLVGMDAMAPVFRHSGHKVRTRRQTVHTYSS